MSKPLLFKLAAFVLVALACVTAMAQTNWPQKPIKVVVAYPAGSMGDNVVRLLSEDLRQRLGQPIVVDNRAGAGGNIGAAFVAQANPDGYTLLVGAANNFAINQFLYRNMGFDPVKAFEPVAVMVDVPSVVFINTALQAKTFSEFASVAQANVGKLNYGSPGAGTPPHLGAEMLNQSARLGLIHVPYKGSPTTVAALLANDIHMMLAGASVGASHVKAGKLRAIAVGGNARVAEFPDVPTLAELGLGSVRASTWWGLAAPKGTPQEVIGKLHRAFREALANPALQQQLHDLGALPVGGTSADMAKLVSDDSRYWQRAIGQMSVKLD
ncbi:MAG TPA: tripartite tricarboxylate transporter substrate-binding protein [Ramlibacter sp.]|nr:tripartite tricarboxylate transporter substrate-binding protein [Ramlibacter sp.]